MVKTGLAFVLFATACATDPADDATTGEAISQVERTPSGQPYFVRGDLGTIDQVRPGAIAELPALRAQVGLTASSELRIRSVEHDTLGMTHVRVNQIKSGLRVVSGDAVLHLDSTGIVRSVDTGLVDRELTSVPTLELARATEIAVAATSGTVASIGTGELVYLVSNKDGQLYLAWEIRLNGTADGVPMSDLVYVDALGDRVVDRHPRIMTAKSRVIRDGQNGAFPVAGATIVGSEATPPTEAIAKAAFDNTGFTHDCYTQLFNRDSYDGAGAELDSQVHIRFDFGGGTLDPNNAIWAADLLTMAYGDGDGSFMTPLARSLDVTAHELTHAVTSSTANLVYQDESGALNESLSDILGVTCESFHKGGVVDKSTWLLGEDIFTPNTPGDALRYMDNPTRDNYSADFYAERLQVATDSGGVHGNSGISNLAFQLLVDGGKHPRNKTNIVVPSIGIKVASEVFYRALTTKMTANTNFAQARTALEQAALELYPTSCAKPAVSLAFAAVGVGSAPAPDTVPPTATITSPANNAAVAAGFSVQADTNDETCISKVELLVDGAVVDTKFEAPYTFTVPATLATGSHDLVIKSYDTANATSSSPVKVRLGAGPGTDGGDGSYDITGGCSTSGGSSSVVLAMLGLGFLVRRRRR